jgi:Ca-activated chloride channel family protein
MKLVKALLLVPAALLFLGGGVSVFAQNDDDPIKIDSNLVVLNATVLDEKGLPVVGLRQKSFHVFEDGVEQKLQFFESEETPFAAVILIDSSGSMEERMMMARSAAITFLGGLREDDMAAIYNFDSNVKLIQDFSQSHDVSEAVHDLKANGMTVLNDAMVQAAQELAKRNEKRKAIVVISDGIDNKSRYSSDQALKAAIAANATVYTVDMSVRFANMTEEMQRTLSIGQLKKFADKSGGKFISTPGGAGLREAFNSIVKEMGNQYTLGYEPSNAVKDGKYRNIELKINDPKATVRTRKGYNALKK